MHPSSAGYNRATCASLLMGFGSLASLADPVVPLCNLPAVIRKSSKFVVKFVVGIAVGTKLHPSCGSETTLFASSEPNLPRKSR